MFFLTLDAEDSIILSFNFKLNFNQIERKDGENMNLTRRAFDLLALLEKKGKGRYTQKELADELSFSVGIVNKYLREFCDAGIVSVTADRTEITAKGLEVLEPYRVKRAVILAAGFSERLAPVTLEIPKPLVRVNDKPIIETIIDAMLAADINDITVVVGYKADMFYELAVKYPSVTLVRNPLFNQSGNITTLHAARDKIDSCYICDADLYIHNPDIISKYEYSSCFFGVPVRETDDWCFTLNGKTIGNFTIGGEKCCKAIFISYLNTGDSAKFRQDIESMINSRGGKERRWFDVLFSNPFHSYGINAKTCYSEDVTEIDTIGDLVKLDDSYLGIHL